MKAQTSFRGRILRAPASRPDAGWLLPKYKYDCKSLRIELEVYEMRHPELSEAVKARLAAEGPMLGKELHARFSEYSHLALWQACFQDLGIHVSHFAGYYLRFDITREDLIRLSPSVLRDFLSFTLISLPHQRGEALARQVEISNLHREISQRKIALARNMLSEILRKLDFSLQRQICAFIAGDNAYFLGHDEPREVEELGQLVRGSDIDIVIIHEDTLDPSIVDMIESEMMKSKTYLLRHPDHRQEVDFICKPRSKMFRQFRYDTIREKIASKIAYESLFVAGSVQFYMQIIEQLEFSGVKPKIEADFRRAAAGRQSAMQALLRADPDDLDLDTQSLFFFSRERLEFD